MFRRACRRRPRWHRVETGDEPLQVGPVWCVAEGQEPGLRAARL